LPSRGRTTPSLRTLALFAGALTLLAGCTHPIPRNRVSDFFAKDFELPEYRPAEGALARQRQQVKPGPAAAALGGTAGAFAGGYRNAWRTGAGAALGDAGGAFVGNSVAHAAHDPPPARDYSALELALPIVATDPNAGLTVGLLPVSIFRESERITNIFAPQITWNEIDGGGALFRMRRSYSVDASLSVDAGSTTNGAHVYDFKYEQARLGPHELLFVRARGRYQTDLTARFYGIGNDTDKDAQSSYTFRRSEGNVALGVQTPWYVRLEFAELLSTSSVGRGQVSGLSSAKRDFPDVPGMDDRVDLLSHRITLTLDTRDAVTCTTRGVFVQAFYEVADATLGSDVYFQRLGLTASGTISYFENRLATAARIAARFVSGGNVPFYELSSVGGKMSLRSYGDGRFYDKNGVIAGVEERWNVLGLRLMDVDTVLQVAGFGEMGRVFKGGDAFTWRSFHYAGGAAFRLLVPASEIVASIDVGYGDEGMQTFVDLGYPF
jgi:hypothetical protein